MILQFPIMSFMGGKVVDFWRVGTDTKNPSGNISTFKIFRFKKKNCFTFLLHFSNAQYDLPSFILLFEKMKKKEICNA